ncbi:hypothetical protein EDD76_109105 [Kineothrix alysoides]|uniref:CAAX prenyl protease 2/Lysostaphin resistance protein A-like domain-containing protein n=1 Tax=Kineothrix alysoides TaxID=1469948 RepID=A0A4R1QVH2_9FIRM|nr:CPBP family intramembrane glutamic endopeptidase [Kineothrix alysoides]TCL57243.1 hypothetical protein EDD76_109105 [Kineothrix alysoides]
MKEQVKIAITPLFIILIGLLTALLFNYYIGAWAFIPLALVYWVALGIFAKVDKISLKGAFVKSGQHRCFNILAYIPCIFCIVAFVWGLQFITFNPLYIILSVIFVIVNPVMEELFWRQYLLEQLKWKNWVKIIYSTILFSLSHPLMWGIFSVTIRSKVMVMPLLIMGILWGSVYLKTKTLRHCIIAHSLVDVLNLSVWVFLNIYIPPVV